MTFDWDQIQAALFTQLRTLLGVNIKFSARRYMDFDQIEPENQPAMLVVATKDTEQHTVEGMPARHHLRSLVVLYVLDPDPTDTAATPETTVFALVKRVKDALALQPGESPSPESLGLPTTTLGGLVRYVKSVDTAIHHGAGGGQAAATIVLEMLAVDY